MHDDVPGGFMPGRGVFLVLGWLCVGLGAIGVVLPVLPTTPFLLLAAACFARSSPRLYRRLLASRTFGPTIRRWQETRSISRRTKMTAIASLAIVGGGSALFCLDSLWARGLLIAVLVGVATWIVRIRTAGDPGEP
jgi:uncharacterized membrane protein YbaN (DUF454 family)